MAQKKMDGVIEAVRYTSEGRIMVVRAYERHGAVWSDWVLLDRQELLERLIQGKRFFTGKRKSYLGSVFNTGAIVHENHDNIVTNGQAGSQDMLSGVPVF